jgi:hypothetical protein
MQIQVLLQRSTSSTGYASRRSPGTDNPPSGGAQETAGLRMTGLVEGRGPGWKSRAESRFSLAVEEDNGSTGADL